VLAVAQAFNARSAPVRNISQQCCESAEPG
jgi:hypothetical protein